MISLPDSMVKMARGANANKEINEMGARFRNGELRAGRALEFCCAGGKCSRAQV